MELCMLSPCLERVRGFVLRALPLVDQRRNVWAVVNDVRRTRFFGSFTVDTFGKRRRLSFQVFPGLDISSSSELNKIGMYRGIYHGPFF